MTRADLTHYGRVCWLFGPDWEPTEVEYLGAAPFPAVPELVAVRPIYPVGECQHVHPRDLWDSRESLLLAGRETISRRIVDINRQIEELQAARSAAHAAYDRLTCELVPGADEAGVGAELGGEAG